jgi:hypothetical protein
MAPNLNDMADLAVETDIETSYKAGEETAHTDEEQAVDSEEDDDMNKPEKDDSEKRTKPFIILVACCAALGTLHHTIICFSRTTSCSYHGTSFLLLDRWSHFWL